MPQVDLTRTDFMARQIITSSLDSVRQEMAFTGYFRANDTVDIIALDACGCQVGSALATGLNVDGIEKDAALTFDSSVDTSTALPAGAVGWYAVVRDIWDGQNAVDRLYRSAPDTNTPGSLQICTNIDSGTLNSPGAGQTAFLTPDVFLFRVNDEVDVFSDNGLIGTGNIDSISINADEANDKSEIVIDALVDISAETNVKICSKNLSVLDVVTRLQENIDAIDEPVENEPMDASDGCMTVFEANDLFLQNSSKVFLDGVRKFPGNAGTRASLSNDTGNAQLDITSMILNSNGNNTEFEMLDPAAPTSALAVTVTGNFNSGYKVSVSLETDGVSAIISTAQEVADAVNADADAKRIMQLIYGGDGTGVQSALVATNLTGGLDDATGWYAELPPVKDNNNTSTGYKFIAFNIDPSDRNKMQSPPRCTEAVYIDYRKALVNA